MNTIQDIQNIDLSFIEHIPSRIILLKGFISLILAQTYIDEEYSKMWTGAEINKDFAKCLSEMNSLNIVDYLKNVNLYRNCDTCLHIISNYVDGESSGTAKAWMFKWLQVMLIHGIDYFRTEIASKW